MTGEIVTAANMNTHVRDNMAHVYGVWQSWSPSLTAITIGDGTQVARYCQIGRQVFFQFRITLGATTSLTGNWGFSLPVAAYDRMVVPGYYWDASASDYYAFMFHNADSTGTTGSVAYAYRIFNYTTASAASTRLKEADGSSPVAEAVNDVIYCSGFYEAG